MHHVATCLSRSQFGFFSLRVAGCLIVTCLSASLGTTCFSETSRSFSEKKDAARLRFFLFVMPLTFASPRFWLFVLWSTHTQLENRPVISRRPVRVISPAPYPSAGLGECLWARKQSGLLEATRAWEYSDGEPATPPPFIYHKRGNSVRTLQIFISLLINNRLWGVFLWLTLPCFTCPQGLLFETCLRRKFI